ncbi:hypothetical protein M409DRAFT_56926 [Zasmidium cellare ATCC 36951]|uniref:Uncharacterized protein n=1 Tax=Zasmidium cellare ATCC 36951 TaxID=1080233 RepID=A0A6A6CEZ4_ZASCE|nr:uncharacterized protein M409DRAFT_56926 [Zasmidium cellare ATCC 36951]KAF2164239.1 hypothetical protein M409DRAFT_56926 [Zasmidium cellare ATCC 36951]
MKFGLIAALGLGLASAAPAALHQEERSLDKRLGPFGLAVVGGVAAAVMGKVIEGFQKSKRSAQTWDDVRGDLLTKLVAGLDDAAEADEATACARRGTFAISNWFQVTDRATVAANTDGAEDLFDCFFISGPATVTFYETSATDLAVSAVMATANAHHITNSPVQPDDASLVWSKLTTPAEVYSFHHIHFFPPASSSSNLQEKMLIFSLACPAALSLCISIVSHIVARSRSTLVATLFTSAYAFGVYSRKYHSRSFLI